MNLYEAEYQSKRVTIEEALDSLKDGDVIGTSQCANEPTAFLRCHRPSPQQRKALPDVCAHVLLCPIVFCPTPSIRIPLIWTSRS